MREYRHLCNEMEDHLTRGNGFNSLKRMWNGQEKPSKGSVAFGFYTECNGEPLKAGKQHKFHDSDRSFCFSA